MTTSLRRVHRSADRRGLRPCAAAGCNERAAKFTNLCDGHNAKRWLYGCPHGRRVKKSELQPYLSIWKRFRRQNKGHPAIVAATAFLDDLFAHPSRYTSRSAVVAELRLQKDLGATGDEALAWVVAQSLWDVTFQISGDADKCSLGYRLLHTKPRPNIRVWTNGKERRGSRPIKRRTTTLKTTSRIITRHLGRFLLHVGEAVDREFQERAAIIEAASTPFTNPNTEKKYQNGKRSHN